MVSFDFLMVLYLILGFIILVVIGCYIREKMLERLNKEGDQEQ